MVAVGCTGPTSEYRRSVGHSADRRAEFNLDEAQTAATRASVERIIAAAPAALSTQGRHAGRHGGRGDRQRADREEIAWDGTPGRCASRHRGGGASLTKRLRSWPPSETTRLTSSRLASGRASMRRGRSSPQPKGRSPGEAPGQVRRSRGGLVGQSQRRAGTDSLRKFVAGLPDEATARACRR